MTTGGASSMIRQTDDPPAADALVDERAATGSFAHVGSAFDPERLQIHLLSFEGPDPYARAGGIASRVTGLARALADHGIDTHLWFVGDPDLPGQEQHDQLHLHRWCQWISRYHRGGVYDGEEGKRHDYVASLPRHLAHQVLLPHLRAGGTGVVLAEEWHTADAVLHLDWLLRQAGERDRVRMLWNANNTFGFDRVDWARLARAAVITTVSRYMRHLMWRFGVNPLVIPNGLSADDLRSPPADAVAALRERFGSRTLVTKVARWDPDKRWLLAVDTVGEMKRAGWCPLLVARGGVEAHGGEVLARAAAAGLRVIERGSAAPGARGLLEALGDIDGADVVRLVSPLDAEARGVLYQGASAVLANSGHEPFGLVGLEAMAAGGVACTGCSGEDYAIPGQNALVLQTNDPREFLSLFAPLRASLAAEHALRAAGRATAAQFAWHAIVPRTLLPCVHLAAPA
jgi:glycosyltransferase involved in cell wall biosynthesis